MTNNLEITFDQLPLSEPVLRALNDISYEHPTEIQAQAIPLILSGRDVIGKSHTGTGKTLAFGIPAVEQCASHADCREVQTLVLCPTRELAMQACDEIRKLTRYIHGVRVVAVYGGQPIQNQIPQLRRGAQIVIGTPGRVFDLIGRKVLKPQNLKMLVLDEADEMLNMGFREDIESILAFLPEERQTTLFSATMPQAILDITDQYQRDPEMIEVSHGEERTIDTVEQYYYEVPLGSKKDALSLLLQVHDPKLAIVFCNTKKMVDELSMYLTGNGFHVAALHGDMKQESRTAVMQAFKSGRTPILIATDVAARGIDVDDVDAVYNFDIPQDYEYYIHRIGRTGRAGRRGVSYTLAAGRRQVFWVRDIEKFINAKIEHRELPSSKDVVRQKQDELLDELRAQLAKTSDEKANRLIVRMMDEGYSPEQIAEGLMVMLLRREVVNVPTVTPVGAKAELPPPPEGYVRLRFSVGRHQRVAPNHIVAAIADATRVPGKQIQKIYCYGDYSLVEVPSKFKNLIISKANGMKIGGHKTDVRLYDSKPASRKSDDGKRRSEDHVSDVPQKKRGSFMKNFRSKPDSRKGGRGSRRS